MVGIFMNKHVLNLSRQHTGFSPDLRKFFPCQGPVGTIIVPVAPVVPAAMLLSNVVFVGGFVMLPEWSRP